MGTLTVLFVYTHLNDFKYYDVTLAIQFNIIQY